MNNFIKENDEIKKKRSLRRKECYGIMVSRIQT